MKEWKRALRIYYAVVNRTRLPLHFPIRGTSAIEIAQYLLAEHKNMLTEEEIAFLESVLK